MFFLNIGYQWGMLEEVAVKGAIFGVSGQDFESSLRRGTPKGPSHILFDPQLYLADYSLNPQEYPTLLSKLCTYPWFCSSAPGYDSGEGRRRNWLNGIKDRIGELWAGRTDVDGRWDAAVSECIRFQEAFGCTQVILPSKLLADPEDSLDRFFQRMDDALAVADLIATRPVMVSVPIDQGLIAHRDPDKNEIVEALADGITARKSVAGVYLTVSRESGPDVRIISPKVAGALLRLCSLLSVSGRVKVIINYADDLGVAAMGFGASSYGSGPSQKGRCLRVEDYQDRDGGGAYPKFSSFWTGLDFYPDPDLERMRDARLLRYFTADRTAASTPLLDALAAGARTSTVAQWAQRRNNVTASRLHFVQLRDAIGDREWNADSVQGWLQDAESRWIYLSTRFEDDPLSEPDGKHLAPWRRAVDLLFQSR